MDDATLRLERVAFEVAGRRLLDGVGGTMWPGEQVALVGANGAGKTTLLRAVAGLLPTTTGVLSATGLDPRTASPADSARRRVYARNTPTAPGTRPSPNSASLPRNPRRGSTGRSDSP